MGEEAMRCSAVSTLVACVFGATLGLCGAPAQAQDLRIVVGTAPGGSYDLTGRLVGRHIGKHLAGNPNVVPQNMPGAGSLTAANHIYNVAPQDGSVIGVLVPAILFNQIFGEENIRFDGGKFQWIGNPLGSAVVSTVFHTAPIKTWRDALTTTVMMGAPGSTAPDATTAHLVNATLGTKFNVISGYKGGQDIVLAMERGEIHGRASQTWAGWLAAKPDWIREGKLVPLFHVARKQVPELKDVPLLVDLVQGEGNKALVRAYVNVIEIGRPLVAGPGVPADRVTALRRAFDATVKDPAFLAEAEKLQIELGPITGEELQAMVREVTQLDKAVIGRLKDVLR
jgi:tripartite-type tricarboxylate transporter receptor subunit TctC